MKSGLVLVFFGLVFLINPNFNMFDILPDFIGFALVCAGLAKYALIDENLSSAKKCSMYCAFLSAAKLAVDKCRAYRLSSAVRICLCGA